MNKIQIEFFHDVLCAWCYAISPRVRRIAKEYPAEIIHRCFALAPAPESIVEFLVLRNRKIINFISLAAGKP